MGSRQVICIAFCVLLASASEAAGRTWWVKKDGTGDTAVIQEAVDAAAPGDTIRIGPGRFEEYRPFTTPYWTENVYVLISTDGLTLIGSGAESTIIGPPEVIYGYGEFPYGIFARSVVNACRVSNLRMENNRYNLVGECHYLEVDSCRFSGGELGLGATGIRVRDCDFSDLTVGLDTGDARNVLVARCRFRVSTVALTLYNTTGAEVVDCEFVGGSSGISIQQFTTGALVRRCRFQDVRFAILSVKFCSMVLHDNVVLGSVISLDAAEIISVQASGNVFGPGSYVTMQFGVGTPTLNGNHILKGGGSAVRLLTYSRPPLASFDFTGNYWGTTSADSIAAWIHDHNDDPAIQAYVVFEPFSTVPLPVQQKTLGGIKGMFR